MQSPRSRRHCSDRRAAGYPSDGRFAGGRSSGVRLQTVNGAFEGVPPVPDLRRRPGCSGCLLRGALFLTFVVAIAAGLHYGSLYIDKRLYPWAYPDSGRPLLVDTWVGRFTTRGGYELAMLIDIELKPLNPERPPRFNFGGAIRRPKLFRDYGADTLSARVFVCDGPGSVRRMTAAGRAYDNRASRFLLWAHPIEDAPPPGLSPSQMHGRWDGGNTIAIQASLHLSYGKGAISSSDDPDIGPRTTPLTLRRGTEAAFDSLCAQLDPSRARRIR
jgi:hypothetical protein